VVVKVLLTLHNTASLKLQRGRVSAENIVGAEEEGEFSYITIHYYSLGIKFKLLFV
jgi:hypothetical protein